MDKLITEQTLSFRQRFTLPLPGFFKKLRIAGLMLTAISATLATGPAGLPDFVATIAGYCAVAGAVVTVVSQTTVSQQAFTPPDQLYGVWRETDV